MNSDELKRALLDRMEDLAPYLYPTGRREGRRWVAGDAAGSPGESFSIVLAGANAGMHGDFASSERHSSSAIDLWMTARQVDFPTACREAREWLGIPPETRQRGPAPQTKPRKVPPPLEPIPPLSQEIMDAIREGMRFAMAGDWFAEEIAEWRGWPMHETRSAIESGLIFAPRYRGSRAAGFPVVAPVPAVRGTGSVAQQLVGFHFRPLRANVPAGQRVQWQYRPMRDKDTGKGGIPALPFILGSFPEARLIVGVEGQWDALSLPIAEGWLAKGATWPAGVAIVGIRGAQGFRPFLERWRAFWPVNAAALLIADNDPAGSKWLEGNRAGEPSFFDLMTERCTKAAIVRVSEHKDVNDALRAGDWPRGELWRLAEACGLAVEPGVAP